jgi:hypothetical protein
MARLVVDLGERPETVRVDLVVLTGDLGVAAVTDVPPGPHRVSVQLAGGWQHQWVFVEEDEPAAGEPPALAAEAVVALPPDGGGWSALTAHLDSRDALFTEWVEPEDDYDVTRFQALLDAHDGDGSRLLALLERSFIEWTLSPDALDEVAGGRWRTLLAAVAGAGPRGVDAAPDLLAEAAAVIATQLAALPPDAVDESIHDALADLRADLADAL